MLSVTAGSFREYLRSDCRWRRSADRMTALGIAEFYARRAFELAADAMQLERWRRELNVLAGVPEEDLLQCCNPVVGRDGSANGMSAQECLGGVLADVAGLVWLLARHGRLSVLGDVAREYSRLLDEHHGLRHAEVVTATPLDAETRRLIEDCLQGTTGAKYVLDGRVDSAIIGGVVLKIGDRVIDRSVRARLQSLRDAVLDGHEFGAPAG
jgi:F-type H+-transporting ATPase subunit delta